MASEDLTAPLGLGKRRLLRLPFGLIGTGLLSVVLTTGLVWMLVVDDPLGGEPIAMVPVGTDIAGLSQRDIEVVEIRPTLEDGALGPNLRPDAASNMLGPRYDLQKHAGQNEITRVDLINPDPRVVERSAYGYLPAVSDDGIRPLDVYARPVVSEYHSVPRIAIIVGGMGLSQTGTESALGLLPADVTLALAPYGENLDRWMQQAREKGHELLLQMPMEPYDFPDNDPGPHTLLVSLTPQEMADRFNWLLTRVTNYVGVINDMGARFMATRPSLQYVFENLTKRGLMFVDDGSSSRSVAGEVAAEVRTPFSGVDVVLDSVPREDEINAKLLQLEGVARARGVAVASASALPVTVRLLEAWSRDLEERGLMLVPVSATIDR